MARPVLSEKMTPEQRSKESGAVSLMVALGEESSKLRNRERGGPEVGFG